MGSKVQRWGRNLLIGCCGWLWFVGMLVWTGPSDPLAEHVAQLLQQQTAGRWQLEYQRTSPHGWPGVALHEPRLLYQEGEHKTVIHFEQLKARMLWWPLFLGRYGARAQTLQGEGRVAIDVIAAGQAVRSVTVHAHRLVLSQLAFLPQVTGLTMGGQLEGTFTSQLAPGNEGIAEGGFNVTWQDGQIGPGQIKGMTLPGLPLGLLKLQGHVQQDVLTLDTVEQEGGMIQIKSTGSLGINVDKGQEGLLCLRIKVDPTWLAQNSSLQAALRLAEMQLRRDGEGYLHVGLQGTLTSPRLRPGLCT